MNQQPGPLHQDDFLLLGSLSRCHLLKAKTWSAEFTPERFAFRSAPREAEGKSPFSCLLQSCWDVGKLQEQLSDLQLFLWASGRQQRPWFPSPVLQFASSHQHVHRAASDSPRAASGRLTPPASSLCPLKYSEDAKPAAGALPVEVSQVPSGSVAFTDTFNAWSWCVAVLDPASPAGSANGAAASRASPESPAGSDSLFYFFFLIWYCLPPLFYLIFFFLPVVWFIFCLFTLWKCTTE